MMDTNMPTQFIRSSQISNTLKFSTSISPTLSFKTHSLCLQTGSGLVATIFKLKENGYGGHPRTK